MTPTFRCGHPMSEKNTRLHGKDNKFRRCRTCDNDRQNVVNKRVRGMAKKATIRLVTFPPLPLPSDLAPPIDTGRSYGLAPRRTA